MFCSCTILVANVLFQPMLRMRRRWRVRYVDSRLWHTSHLLQHSRLLQVPLQRWLHWKRLCLPRSCRFTYFLSDRSWHVVKNKDRGFGKRKWPEGFKSGYPVRMWGQTSTKLNCVLLKFLLPTLKCYVVQTTKRQYWVHVNRIICIFCITLIVGLSGLHAVCDSRWGNFEFTISMQISRLCSKTIMVTSVKYGQTDEPTDHATETSVALAGVADT